MGFGPEAKTSQAAGANHPCSLIHPVTTRQDGQLGAATAAPTDDLLGGGTAMDAGPFHSCPECLRTFETVRDLSQHRRRAHPLEYHAQNVPIAKLKARWDHEELFILARAEITIRLSGVSNVNQQLARITPGRTLEAIKGVRKSTKYQELLASLEQQEADGSEFVERTLSVPDEGAPVDISEDPIQAPPDQSVEWAGQVRNAIYDLGVPDGIDLDAISPGNPNDQTRAMLDTEYARWLPPLAGPNRQRPPGQRTGAPRVRTGLPVRSARVRGRAAYART